jgi:alanyl-tRNA synthetase
VRRIEAVTGPAAVRLARQEREVVLQLSRALNAAPGELASKVQALQSEVKALRKGGGGGGGGADVAGALAEKLRTEDGKVLLTWRFEGDLTPDQARSALDTLFKKHKLTAGVVVGRSGDAAFGIVAVRPDLAGKPLDAGAIARELGRLCGGSGGGKPHMAQFGVKDEAKVDAAFEAFEKAARSA